MTKQEATDQGWAIFDVYDGKGALVGQRGEKRVGEAIVNLHGDTEEKLCEAIQFWVDHRAARGVREEATPVEPGVTASRPRRRSQTVKA